MVHLHLTCISPSFAVQIRPEMSLEASSTVSNICEDCQHKKVSHCGTRRLAVVRRPFADWQVLLCASNQL